MALIDQTNFSTMLKESTNPRGSSPNGNVYFDTANNKIQLLVSQELQQIDFGSGLVQNPLNATDGITMRALYNFENARRRVNENLRKYKRGIKGSYRFAGAFNFVNGVKLSTTSERKLLRTSGFIEYAATGDGETSKDRIYHGVVSLVDVAGTTTPYYSFVTSQDEASLQAATWSNFGRDGDINEVVQVFGTTANGDTGAGDFDYTGRTLVVRVRSWQRNPGETTSVATGISEFSGFSAGYGVGESQNPANDYDFGSVIGTYAGQSETGVAPFTGMSLEKYASPQTKSGFNQGSAAFSWVLHNTLGGTARECAAFLDAISLLNADIEATGTTSYLGKRGRLWYYRDAAGKIVTNSFGNQGLYIEGLSTAEQQNVVLTSDTQGARTYPYFPSVEISVGAIALSDPNAWLRVMYADGAGGADFDTSGAVTVKNSSGVDVNGLVSAMQAGGKVSFPYAYDTDTNAGLVAGTDKACVVLVEGDGIAGQSITYFTIKRDPVIAVTCAPPVDNNA